MTLSGPNDIEPKLPKSRLLRSSLFQWFPSTHDRCRLNPRNTGVCTKMADDVLHGCEHYKRKCKLVVKRSRFTLNLYLI